MLQACINIYIFFNRVYYYFFLDDITTESTTNKKDSFFMVIHVRSVYLIFGSFQISFSKRYSKYMLRIYIGMSIGMYIFFKITNILNTSIYLILAELHGSSKNQNSQEISCHSEQVFSFQNSFYYRL